MSSAQGDSEPHRLTVEGLRTNGGLEELAKVFGAGNAAEELLDRVRFPRARRPASARTPNDFWSQACREIENGLIEGGIELLLTEALSLYPNNTLFKELAGTRQQLTEAQPPTELPRPTMPFVAPTPTMATYDVFLCHASANRPEVEALAGRLRKDGIEPFLDKWHLIPGEPWQQALENALEASCTCAVFVGHGEGPWQNMEMRAALSRLVGDKTFRVIPVLLPGAPPLAELPSFLRQLGAVECYDRWDDDGVYHRLVSGIRGVQPGAGAIPVSDVNRSASDPPDTESLMRAVWLYDHDLFDVEKSSLADRLVGLCNDRRTAKQVADQFLERSEPLAKTLSQLCRAMTDDWHDDQLRIRPTGLVRKLVKIVDPDAILVLDPNLDLPDDEKFDWPAIPPVDEPVIHDLLEESGSIDTHIHFTGILPPVFYWLSLMDGQFPDDVLHDYFPADVGRQLASEEKWIQSIRRATKLRCELATRIEEESIRCKEVRCFPGLEKGWQRQPALEADWPFVDPLRSPAHNGRRAHYASGERRMLYEVGKLLHQGQRACEKQLLEYLRIRNAFHRLLVLDLGEGNLDRFMGNFQRRGLIHRRQQPVEHVVRRQFAAALDEQLVDPYSLHTTLPRRIEIRLSLPTNSPKELIPHLRSWLMGIKDHLTGAGELRDSQVGLVFHFVKKARYSHKQQMDKALAEATCLADVLIKYPLLRHFIVGIDAAGDERSSHPRIFAPAFHCLQQTGLGFTFHVGEDVDDLLTGLRHVDEAVSFLLRGEGRRRLGHGLVLGQDPDNFYRGRSQPYRPAHLLDLVWAWGRLRRLPETATLCAALKGRIRDRCATASSKISTCFEAMMLKEPLMEQELLDSLTAGEAVDPRDVVIDDLWIRTTRQIQGFLRKSISSKEICIEVSPTSNRTIGHFDNYSSLPYRPMTDAGIPMTINTDDPGLFMTSLPGEFSAILSAPDELDEVWLKDRIRNAESNTFLNLKGPTGAAAVELIQKALHQMSPRGGTWIAPVTGMAHSRSPRGPAW